MSKSSVASTIAAVTASSAFVAYAVYVVMNPVRPAPPRSTPPVSTPQPPQPAPSRRPSPPATPPAVSGPALPGLSPAWRITDVAAAHHSAATGRPAFDRLTFTFQGGLPAYRADYVDVVRGRDDARAVKAFVLVTFAPDLRRDSRERLAVPDSQSRRVHLGFPLLVQYTFGIDEKTGHRVCVLGLSGRLRLRVGTTPGAGLRYIDLLSS